MKALAGVGLVWRRLRLIRRFLFQRQLVERFFFVVGSAENGIFCAVLFNQLFDVAGVRFRLSFHDAHE